MSDEYAVVYFRGERMPVPVSRRELGMNLKKAGEYCKRYHLRPGQINYPDDWSEDVLQTFLTALAEATRRGLIHLGIQI